MHKIQDSGKRGVEVEVSAESMQSWIDRPYVSESLKTELAKCQLLAVPTEGFRGDDRPVFPEGSSGLFEYLSESLPKDCQLGLCVDDDQYWELHLHDVTIGLGTFIMTAVVAPIFVSLTAKYLEKKLMKGDDVTSDRVLLELEITSAGGATKKLKYDGPAKTFEQTMSKTISSLQIDDGGHDGDDSGRS